MVPAPKSDHIPIHKLQERTVLGMYMRYIEKISEKDDLPMQAHRDDHYIFIFQETGSSKLIIDFKHLSADGHAVLYILPGQVHHVEMSDESGGWFMAIDTSLVEEQYRNKFEELSLNHQSAVPTLQHAGQLKKCAALLYDLFEQFQQSAANPAIINSLASVYIGLIAEAYQQNGFEQSKTNARPEIITRQFKNLLNQEFKMHKSPGHYAAALCLSLSYLNEAVKATTGFTVSYWIHQEIILEAKRLLYYSDLNVKEIAFALGYEDHTYFSRLFAKVAGVSALGFRKLYRK